MKKSLVLFLFLFLALNVAVFCEQVWLKSYSGSGDTIFNSFSITSDGGIVAVGSAVTSTSPTFLEDGEADTNLLIAKLNTNGEIEWQKSYGESGSEYGYAVIESTSGGYVAVGETTSFEASSTDAFIVRVDEGGKVLWAKRIGGSSEDYAVDVKETDKGDYVVLGVTKTGEKDNTTANYDIFLVGIDEYGSVLWQKQYVGAGDDVAYNILKTKEGDFVITGATTSKGLGDYDALVMKTDAGGVVKWQKFFGTSNDDYGYYLTESKDGGYLLVGETFLKDRKNRTGFSNAYIVRINSFGGDEWQKSYGFGKNNFAYSAKPLGNHGFVIGGVSKETTGSFAAWTFKIDWSGKIIWKTGYDFQGNEAVYCAKPQKDGSLSILGVVNSGTNVYSFLGKGDKEGKFGSCSYVVDCPIIKQGGSFGSGILSLSTNEGALTCKGVKEFVKVTESDISEETLCE